MIFDDVKIVLRFHFPLKRDIMSLQLSHYCHISVFFVILLLLVLVEQLQENLKPLDT
jgi:hypothetical protein